MSQYLQFRRGYMLNCKIKYEDNFGEMGFIDNIMYILKLLSYKKIGNMIYR